MPEALRLVIDGAEMERILRGPDGPVARHLIRVADEVIVVARDLINSRRRWPSQATHRLERTIVKRSTMGPNGIGMIVIAGIGLKPGYAVWVHEGNGPPGGRIYPKNSAVLAWVTSGARPTDKMGWRDASSAGRAIVRRSVATSRPNPYLRDALERVVGISH